MLDFYVKTRIRFSLRDKRLFEITEVEITRVHCIWKQYSEGTQSGLKVRYSMIKNGRCDEKFVIFEEFDIILLTRWTQSMQKFSRKQYIEDIYFFEVNTKYISSNVMEIPVNSRVHSTSEFSDIFNTRDEIVLVFTK